MLTSPWNLILTALFAATGASCVVGLVAHRTRPHAADAALTPRTIIDVNQLLVSAAIVLMIWVTPFDAVIWAQVAVFAIFGMALLPDLVGAARAAGRISLLGHLIVNAATIWVLLAMPLLMAKTTNDPASSGHHHGGEGAATQMGTPLWADIVNWLFVGLTAGAALWWIVALISHRSRQVRSIRYASVAAGMAVMLIVMNS